MVAGGPPFVGAGGRVKIGGSVAISFGVVVGRVLTDPLLLVAGEPDGVEVGPTATPCGVLDGDDVGVVFPPLVSTASAMPTTTTSRIAAPKIHIADERFPPV